MNHLMLVAALGSFVLTDTGASEATQRRSRTTPMVTTPPVAPGLAIDTAAADRMTRSGAYRVECRNNRHRLIVNGRSLPVRNAYGQGNLCRDGSAPELRGVVDLPGGERLLLAVGDAGYVIRTSPRAAPRIIEIADIGHFNAVYSATRLSAGTLGAVPMPGTNCTQIGNRDAITLDWRRQRISSRTTQPDLDCGPAPARPRR